MDLQTVVDELYGLPPHEFTATRDTLAADARQDGDKDLASSVKRLRKPSAGAWIANMLAREQPDEITRLVDLGEELRSTGSPDGEQIRQASKDKTDSVSTLLRQARDIAKRAGSPLSMATEQDLESTLDAAFSDPVSAASLLQGSLTSGLHYSGLGFGGATKPRRGSASEPSTDQHAASAGTTANTKLQAAFEKATREAQQSDVEAEQAGRAVVSAEADLQRLRAALAVADRKATGARKKASDARKRLETQKANRRR